MNLPPELPCDGSGIPSKPSPENRKQCEFSAAVNRSQPLDCDLNTVNQPGTSATACVQIRVDKSKQK